SDFTYIYYESKEELFKILVQNEKSGKREKKLMILLGSSRLLYFDAKDLSDFYPDWDIYNFSSAVTTPAYYSYYLEKILDAGIRPDLILMETDPNQFNANTPIFRNSNLTYSFSLPFVLKHASVFGKENISFYLGKFLFASSKNKPYIATAYKRLTDSRFMALAAMGEITRKFLLDNKGNALSPIENYVEKDFGVLDATSKRTMDWLFSSYKESEMQYTFYEMNLERIKKENIPLLVVWPQSSLPMQKMMKNSFAVQKWKSRVDLVSQKFGFQIQDMDSTDQYYCNSFADGGHIAKDCYHPFMRYVVAMYYRNYSQSK
ncbi:MAG: DUF1574 domain-containing protein, partial [Leptospira sp.]|nr:DUF1574 domain-containing protein [Leptospira sp.]